MGTTGENLVWLEPKWQFGFLEDLVTLTDQLHGESFLSQIVICLDNHSEQAPCLQPLEGRILLQSGLLLF